MPPATSPRQAGVSSWFDTRAGVSLLAVEQAGILAGLRSRPAQPWLWIAPVPPLDPRPDLDARGFRLRWRGTGYEGDLRCGLPLPLAAESVQSIVLQHVPVGRLDELLGECERVLMPGGRLWLYALNPYSPYRLRWQRRGLRTLRPLTWRQRVQAAGLRCLGQEGYLGPAWRIDTGVDVQAPTPLPWRAVCVLEAEKRVAAGIGPIPATVRRLRPAVTV